MGEILGGSRVADNRFFTNFGRTSTGYGDFPFRKPQDIAFAGYPMRFLRPFFPWAGLAVFLTLTFAVRCWNSAQVFSGGATYFVDADCYSRMTRVQRVRAHPLQSIRFHDFENAPFGTAPHTTAPMDLLIAALTLITRSLDLAGALISPLLAVVLTGLLWWWGRKLKLPYRNALLMVVIFSPILVHGFLLGRPDHQSLILLLLGAALAAELALWTQPLQKWSIISALCWALALWTSLFEPLILLLAVLACRVFVLGRKAWPLTHPAAPGIFLILLAVAFLFDGWRPLASSPETREFFPRWSQTIGELNHLTPAQVFNWTGWLLPVVPILLVLRFRKEKNRVCLALAFLVILTSALSLWYARWGYFLALVFAFSLPWALASIPKKPVVWIIFLISLWPIASEWERQIFPDTARQAALTESLEDAVLLREAARALVSPQRTIILAPWWLSPALAYWSGQPCVAGSSHQSLPGIADTARFYLATDPLAAREILQKRNVQYVVAYEPPRVMANSAQILGLAPPRESLGKLLFDNPYASPRWLRLAYENKFFKVYEVKN